MLNTIFISEAFSQTQDAISKTGEFSLVSFVPLILIFVVFYFLIIRPQTKKYKEHQEMVGNLKIGNKVITSGGIIGVVKEIITKEDQIEVEIASGVIVKILKNHISDIVKKEKEEQKK